MPYVDVLVRRWKSKKIQTNASLRRDFGIGPHLDDEPIFRVDHGIVSSQYQRHVRLLVLVCRAVLSTLVTVDYFQVSRRFMDMRPANLNPAPEGRHRHPHRRRTNEAKTSGAVGDSTESNTSSEARITEWQWL